MNITDKSKKYAEGKALNAITAAIEDAYSAGYLEGYADGYANREKPEALPKYKNVSYIDLELPSGTKWATDYLTKNNGEIELLRYDEAKVYNIPSLEQFKELLDNTEQFMTNRDGQLVTEFVSLRNRARFWLPNGYLNYNKNIIKNNNYMFWIRESLKFEGANYAKGPTMRTGDVLFQLYSMPVVLVSKK